MQETDSNPAKTYRSVLLMLLFAALLTLNGVHIQSQYLLFFFSQN